ncbi:DUF4132 domain-containing protein [Chitinophaga qingshengii]|uniref:DUF4132 domain-containing protein n=1 Tax=Chitinophaga qingshengii TaxID=1569794 RepID=A0ABR7TUJ7_9BACT|nr:DUF4132 domain-containing protein [Chitinophaga qingshengii]MBC9933074.1 DUF4132 domain-containing protein [Chitinophaga qingshengii]
MDVKEFLKTRTKPHYIENLTAALKAVYGGETTDPLLTKETAEIVLILFNELLTVEKQHGYYQTFAITYKDQKYIRLEELIQKGFWDTTEGGNLLEYLFGKETAAYVKHAWEQMPYQMYQTGYARRSFRAPNDPEVYFVLQLEFLRQIIPQACQYAYYPKSEYTCFDLSLEEQVRYEDNLFGATLYRIWSAAIDLGNESFFKVCEDIIYNKDPQGKVSKALIKALLNSNKPEAWQLVEKLLLAAQRQEGLRQTIMESLDETSVGALKYMLKVVLDNKLTRFSAVVRALDVWTGLFWEAEKESTVRAFLEKGSEYLETPAKIPEAVKSKNNTDVYMALWALGVLDVMATYPLVFQLLKDKSAEKRGLALKFAVETSYYNVDMPAAYEGLLDPSLAVKARALVIINNKIHFNTEHYDKHYPELFDRLHAIVQQIPEKEKTFEGDIFSWHSIKYDRNNVFSGMINLVNGREDRLNIVLGYFDEMNVTLREQLSRNLLKGYSAYGSNQNDYPEEPLTPFQRSFALRLLKDRGEYVVSIAFHALSREQFSLSEMETFTDILKRKSAATRGKAIEMILRQQDDTVTAVTEKLLQGDVEQRLGGLDVALRLQKANRLAAQRTSWITTFRERKSISQKEEILLNQLSEDNNVLSFSAENGYGLYDPAAISPIKLPAADANDYYSKCLAEGPFGFTMPLETLHEKFIQLNELLQQHAAHEYEVENYDNSRVMVLLGNNFRNVKLYNHKFASKEEEYNHYPLPEVWEGWYQASGLQPRDLYILSHLVKDVYDLREGALGASLLDNYLPTYEQVMPEVLRGERRHKSGDPVLKVLQTLELIHPFEQAVAFMLGGCKQVFNALTPEILQHQEKTYRGITGWQSGTLLGTFLMYMNDMPKDRQQAEDCWNLYHWRQFSGLPELAPGYLPPLDVFLKAYEANVISESEMYRGLISAENIRVLSGSKHAYRRQSRENYFEQYSFLEKMYTKVREHFLDIELKRGDSATPVTNMVQVLQVIYGVQRFGEIWAGLGKTTLHRGYVYSYSGDALSKQQVFSLLLKRCFPLPEDTQAMFDETVKKIKLTEAQLVEAAVYAPQWQKFVSQHLGWKGLDSAIWWMHAHTKSNSNEVNAEAESEIARYSAVDLQDFKDGAVDKDWFLKAYKELGKQRWPIVYEAAKFISDGNAHRRARLYADVITGDLKIKEVTQKVKDKRDQDYLRLYGLIPLSKANAEKDVLARYEYLQQFKKESRQFGAQKQSSEALALRIAMENLARNAGYADPQRLSWAMETRQVQGILSKETQVQYDDVLIGLVIDEEGQADVVAFKGDKQLKAIPPKYKKDKKIEELNDHKKTLREQFRRSRKGLEDAMVRGDVFSFDEISTLFDHPVIAKHLEKLVFITDKGHGFYQSGSLIDAAGKQTKLAAKDGIRIAHSADLHQAGVWSDYQRYCFEKSVQQPFKQIFRELYVPLEDELKEVSVSRRYAGHQVQPIQTVALLKTRGWKVDYEEGLQKVFHKEGFVAKIYAMADWFSPAEVESPTLETVKFHNLKTYTPVAFKDISPLIFSEVMRDLDLVVSVAHVGGVDPEASHSSIEMRKVLLEETLRLFKLNNVKVNGNHATIKGEMGEYSVHLGSAVVHQLPGRYLSILPVHSQHRGRVFLPFVDDDPKSAELISKVLLLARDHEIQDPTVLEQISRN